MSARSPLCSKRLRNEVPRLSSWLGIPAWSSGRRVRREMARFLLIWYNIGNDSNLGLLCVRNDFEMQFQGYPRGISAWRSGVWPALCWYDMASKRSVRSPVWVKRLWIAITRLLRYLGMLDMSASVRSIAFCWYNMAWDMSARSPVDLKRLKKKEFPRLFRWMDMFCMALRSKLNRCLLARCGFGNVGIISCAFFFEMQSRGYTGSRAGLHGPPEWDGLLLADIIWLRECRKISCEFEVTLKCNSKVTLVTGAYRACLHGPQEWYEVLSAGMIWLRKCRPDFFQISCVFKFEANLKSNSEVTLVGGHVCMVLRSKAFFWYDMASEMSLWSPVCSKRLREMNFRAYSACCASLHGPQERDVLLSADMILLRKCRRHFLRGWSDDKMIPQVYSIDQVCLDGPGE